jgi:hypothetical protein
MNKIDKIIKYVHMVRAQCLKETHRGPSFIIIEGKDTQISIDIAREDHYNLVSKWQAIKAAFAGKPARNPVVFPLDNMNLIYNDEPTGRNAITAVRLGSLLRHTTEYHPGCDIPNTHIVLSDEVQEFRYFTQVVYNNKTL